MSDQYFHCKFPPHFAQFNINQLEMRTLLLAVRIWAHRLTGSRISLSCDNMVTVEAINRHKTRDPVLQEALRELCYLTTIFQFEVKAIHIPGIENKIADWFTPSIRNILKNGIKIIIS